MRALTVDRVVSTRVRRGSPNDCEELRRCRYRGRPWRMTRASALLAALAASRRPALAGLGRRLDLVAADGDRGVRTGRRRAGHVEAFQAAVGEFEADRGEDAVAVLAQGAGEPDERAEPGS